MGVVDRVGGCVHNMIYSSVNGISFYFTCSVLPPSSDVHIRSQQPSLLTSCGYAVVRTDRVDGKFQPDSEAQQDRW